MTKEIIIDGVNVAECEHLFGDCFAFYVENDKKVTSCNLHTNCYFKQLAREKQKNEELKKENENYLGKIDELLTENGKLEAKGYRYEQALKEIREKIESIKDDNFYYKESWTAIINKINEVLNE